MFDQGLDVDGRYILKSGTYIDQTANAAFVGIRDVVTGKFNVTILANETAWSGGIYAKNGSLVVVHGAGKGVYSPCGAFNVTFT